jgi:hypothetical protein
MIDHALQGWRIESPSLDLMVSAKGLRRTECECLLIWEGNRGLLLS